jgi:hypothetical protein
MTRKVFIWSLLFLKAAHTILRLTFPFENVISQVGSLKWGPILKDAKVWVAVSIMSLA